MDFILVVELAVFLFHHAAWNALRKTSPWRDFVQDTEMLVLAHYFDGFASYKELRLSRDSWLAEQCNQTGRLNPRPV